MTTCAGMWLERKACATAVSSRYSHMPQSQKSIWAFWLHRIVNTQSHTRSITISSAFLLTPHADVWQWRGHTPTLRHQCQPSWNHHWKSHWGRKDANQLYFSVLYLSSYLVCVQKLHELGDYVGNVIWHPLSRDRCVAAKCFEFVLYVTYRIEAYHPWKDKLSLFNELNTSVRQVSRAIHLGSEKSSTAVGLSFWLNLHSSQRSFVHPLWHFSTSEPTHLWVEHYTVMSCAHLPAELAE